MIIPATVPRIGRRQTLPNDAPDQTELEITPSTTTVNATGTSGLLSSAANGTKLAWWQLLCIALGGAIALCISIWIYWRHRRKRKTDKKRKKEAEKEQDTRVKEELERQQKEEEDAKKGKGRKGKKGRGSDSDWSSSEESYDSVSDGGTIRPRRRRKMDRGRGRRRGRPGRGRRRDWSDSESETESDSYDSDFSYRPRDRRRRGRRRGRYGDGDSDDDINDIYDRRESRKRERGGRRYEPETPTPPVPSLPGKARNKRETFRDSVFSSYSSMKKAAVRLKYVEQKVKLKKELEAEEAVEQARRDKVVQANRDIKRLKEDEDRARMIDEIKAENKMRRVEKEMEEANREVEEANWRLERSRRPMSRVQSSGDSGQPLIPPARPYTLSSSGGSSASTSQLRSPPSRRRPTEQLTHHQGPQIPPAAKLPHSKAKGDTLFDAGALDTAVPAKKPTLRPPARKQSTFAPTAALPYATPHPPPPARRSTGLDTEINNLLGTRDALSAPRAGQPPKPQKSLAQDFSRPPLPPEPGNAFQASWLSRPDPALGVPQTARTNSVYVPVTRPKDRPVILPGGLAPAPPGKKKTSSPRDGARGDSGSIPSAGGGHKWADRMRARR